MSLARVVLADEGGRIAGGSSVDCQALELGFGRRNGGFLLGVVEVRMGVEGWVESKGVAAGAAGSIVASIFPAFGAFGANASGTTRAGSVLVGIESGAQLFC